MANLRHLVSWFRCHFWMWMLSIRNALLRPHFRRSKWTRRMVTMNPCIHAVGMVILVGSTTWYHTRWDRIQTKLEGTARSTYICRHLILTPKMTAMIWGVCEISSKFWKFSWIFYVNGNHIINNIIVPRIETSKQWFPEEFHYYGKSTIDKVSISMFNQIQVVSVSKG